MGFLPHVISELASGTLDLLFFHGTLKKGSGGMPEWPKGVDCKSTAERFGGSNPPPATTTKVVANTRSAAVREMTHRSLRRFAQRGNG